MKKKVVVKKEFNMKKGLMIGLIVFLLCVAILVSVLLFSKKDIQMSPKSRRSVRAYDILYKTTPTTPLYDWLMSHPSYNSEICSPKVMVTQYKTTPSVQCCNNPPRTNLEILHSKASLLRKYLDLNCNNPSSQNQQTCKDLKDVSLLCGWNPDDLYYKAPA